MAKGDTKTDQSVPQASQSSIQPQQNQYLNGNPGIDTQANTRWMDPSQSSPTTGINGGGTPGGKVQQPLTNGTMLGQISSGQVGQYMPQGYDQGKFGDQNKHDPKYDVGRILSKYPPGPEGLQSARNELQQAGYQVVGKDKIQGPAGLIDVGQNFSDPNAQHNWYWSGDLNAGGNQNQQNPMMNNGSMLGTQNTPNFLQQMFQQMQARRNMFANQQFNPSGGSVPMSAQYGQSQNQINPSQMVSDQQSMLQPLNQSPQDVLGQMWAGTYKPYQGPQ